MAKAYKKWVIQRWNPMEGVWTLREFTLSDSRTKTIMLYDEAYGSSNRFIADTSTVRCVPCRVRHRWFSRRTIKIDPKYGGES